jgi:hypothetical protein
MDVDEPRARHRGFFLHSVDPDDADATEYESSEGFPVRFRASKTTSVPRQMAAVGRSRSQARVEVTRPQIRSGSVTGSRQRAHLPR